MLVKCILNNINLIEDQNLKVRVNAEIESPKGLIPVSLDETYVVYGIEFWGDAFPRYYICDDRYSRINYPIAYFSEFFYVIDNHISKHWAFGIRNGQNGKKYPIFSFKEWVENNKFYENIIEGLLESRSVFEKYKKIIDDEAYGRS